MDKITRWYRRNFIVIRNFKPKREDIKFLIQIAIMLITLFIVSSNYILQLHNQEPDLRIGGVQFGINGNREPSIRFALINSHSAKYPAYIDNINIFLNEDFIKLSESPTFENNVSKDIKNFRIVSPGETAYIEFIFSEQQIMSSSRYLQYYIPKNKLREGLNPIILFIEYRDIENGNKWTYSIPYVVDYRNGILYSANQKE